MHANKHESLIDFRIFKRLRNLQTSRWYMDPSPLRGIRDFQKKIRQADEMMYMVKIPAGTISQSHSKGN